MKKISFAVVLLLVCSAALRAQDAGSPAQKTSSYLESIRGNESLLRAFFHLMPKGGDLHHHFSGAVYAETFFDTAVGKHFSLDTSALIIYPPGYPTGGVKSVVPFDSMRAGKRAYFKDRLVRLWSVKDFASCDGASDAHFFSTFSSFGPAIGGSEAPMLQEIKRRAITEHTDYIETMFLRPSMPPLPEIFRLYSEFNPQFESLQSNHDTAAMMRLMSNLMEELASKFSADSLASIHHSHLVAIRDAAVLPGGLDSIVRVRFLNYVTRVSTPADVFAQLYLSFASCDMDSLVMGVNIVAPENADVSMHDYWLQMQMFKFFRRIFPKVHTSMHAGELTLGMVKPEDLTWHISSAVLDAGAERIGHGVDIAYERHSYDLLREMAKRHIVIEINLTSNEFILHEKNSAHPISLYAKFGVPIVISTDDPGVLRSDHTGEFVKLAMRYPQFSYSDIKHFIYNSIEYSFLKASDKAAMKSRLDREFASFEKTISIIE